MKKEDNVNKKLKVLMLSDHALSTSGVGCQSRFLINGLIEKGCWTFRQLGAAIKHSDYSTVKVNDDFIIKPIDGFGDRELIIQTLATEKPDILFLFTDPRFFIWLWEMEDEVQVTVIATDLPAYESELLAEGDLEIILEESVAQEMEREQDGPDRTRPIQARPKLR